MRQNIIFSTLAVAVAPAAAMAAPGHYMSDKGVAIAVTGGSEQTVFESSTVQLPRTNDDEQLGLRAFYLTYDFANSNLPTGTKVRIYYGDVKLSERDASAVSSVYPITPGKDKFVVPADFPTSAKLKLTVQLPDGVETGSITGIYLTTNLANNNKYYVKEVLLKEFYDKVQQYSSSIGSKGYVNSADDNASLLLFQDLSVEGNEEKTVENYEKYDIFNGTETIEQAFKELKAKIEKAEIDRKIAAAQEAIGDIDAKKQALQDIIDDPEASDEAKQIAQDILDNINSMADKQKELDEAKNAMTEYDETNADNVEALTAVQKKGKDIEAQSKYIVWKQKALDVQTAIDQYKALLDELDATVGKDVTLYGEDEADAGKYKEGGSSLGAYQLLAFRNWKGRLKGKQAALEAFIAKGADNYKAYVDGTATDFTDPVNVQGGVWLKDGDGNDITSLTDAAYDGYAWLNGTEAAYVAALKATKKYTDEQIDNKINALKSSVFGVISPFANIEALLGTEKTPEIGSNGIPKCINDVSVLGNIAYVKGCALLYQQKAAQIFDEVIAAKKDYDERMTQLGAKFQEYKYTDGGEEKVVFADNLPWIKDQMYNLIMDGPGETLGILDVKKAVTDAMKDGNPISYETGHDNSGFGAADPDFNVPSQFVPWQLWSNRLLKVLTTDPNSYAVQYITGWKDKAEQAYTRYTDLKKLVTGTDDKTAQLQAMLNDLLPGEGDPAIDATVQAKLANIQTYINGLSAKLDEVVNNIVDTEPIDNTIDYKDDFEINTAAFDKTASGNAWNDKNYGDATLDPYHSYANIKKQIENMSAALTALANIDAAAQRLKTASDALDALTPAVAVNDGDPTYTDPAYKASDFYGYKNIDDPTTAADEAAQNDGFAKTITDWLKAARQKLINNDYSSNPNPDYTSDSFTDGEDQNTYPGFYDSNTNILHWSDINDEIMKLETGGDGNGKVNKWKTQLDKIKDDEARIKEIEDQVKNHGIYNYQDPNNSNKSYKDLIDGWRDHIKSFKDSHDWYADSYTNKADAHWTDLDGAEYTSITDFKTDTQIAADMHDYALIDMRKRVDDNFTTLYGTNGYDAEGAGEKAGYVDTVLGKYALVKAAYDKWIADNGGDEDAAFGSTANSAKRGNALTLHKIMSETETTGMLKRIQNTTGGEANSDQSIAIQKYKSLPATTAPDYEDKLKEVNDLLLRVKDELDVFYLDLQEGAKQNDITATEGKPNATLDDMEIKPTNLGLLQQLIDDLGNNKLRYDEINKMKGRLHNRVESALEELENKKTSLGGTTPEIDDLKALVESDYKPVTSDEEAKIQAFYVDCKAKDQGSDKTQIYSNKDAETGKFWVLDKDNDYDQGEGREVEYYILKKTLDNLNKLMKDFNDGYDDMVADNNANTYANSVMPAFNDAMAVFDKAIGILNKFKTPTDDELLDAYKVAFNTFTPAIQGAPNATRAAQKTANDKMEAANDAQKLYDPTNDVAAINAIKADAVTAINNFIEAMQTAAQDKLEAAGGAKELANAAIYEANVKILNGGDPYKFNDVNGAPYVYSEAVYFKDEKDIIADANDKANMIKDNVNAWTDAADGIHEGDFEQFLQFDELIQDEENGLQSIPASVQEKLNQAAYEDLGNRIKEFEEAEVTPIANKFKGGYGEYTEKINQTQFEALKAAGEVEATVDFDDFCDEYGYGIEAADGNRYTYLFALGDDFEATKKLFDDLKEATVDEAKNLNKKYYDENHLPEYDGKDENGNDVTFQTRQEVLDLLDTFNTADLDESLDADKQEVIDALDNAYQQKVIDNQQYIADYNAFGERLAAEKEGIESLYVGSDFAAQLKALEDDYKAHGSDADIDDLNLQLDQIVKDAKKAETEALTQEIINLKDDYDQMVKEADDKITAFETNNGDPSTWTDEQKAEYAALKDTRDDLVKKYTTDDEVEQGETPTKDQLALDIAVNTNTLNGYDTNIDDTNVPFFGVDTSADNDPSYDELKELEGNVSKIKEQIAIDRGDKTAEQIAALADGLLDRWQKVWDAESKYIPGQKLMEPENPLEKGFLGKDFGLNKYYLNADFTAYQENYLKGYIAALNALKANIEAHADDIMLFFDKFDQSLSLYEQWLLPDAEGKPSKVDNFINCNDADVQADSYFLRSEAQKEMAQKHAEAKSALLEDIKEVWKKLNKAKSDIDGYQLTTIDGDGNEVPVALDYDSYAKKLNQLEVRLNTYYLKRDGKMGDGDFDENVNLNGNKGAKQYMLYLFDENAKQITDEWLAGFAAGEGDNMVTLAQYLDKETGIVELPACDGLTKISKDIADEVAYYSFMAAQEEFDKAEAAYDEAMTTIGDTEMRFADKMDLYRRMYGTDITNPDETEYEEDEFGNPVLDGEGNPVVAKEDGSFQKLLADLEAVIGDQTPETMDAYKERVEAYIQALNALSIEAKATRVGDIAGGGEDGLQPDGSVDVIDLQRLLNLVNQPSEQKELTTKQFQASDLNNDGYIDIVDLGVMCDIMVGATDYLHEVDPVTGESVFASRQLATTSETLRADVVATDGNSQRIAISLSNERAYTGFQMDITLPEGMRLVGQSLSDRADGQQLYANEWNGKTRLVGFTATKAAFTGNDGAVVYLDVETDESYKGGSVKYDDIIFLTTNAKGVKFQMQGETTGVISRFADAAKETIYNLGGRVMNGLKKGVNILRGNDGAKKVIKK